MTRPRTVLTLAALLLVGVVHAFEWAPLEFEPRPQAYTIEVLDAAGEVVTTLDIDITAAGDAFDVTTVQTTRSAGVDAADLDTAALTGGGGLFGFAGAAFFGPAFMLLPLILLDQDVAVRDAPIEVAGYGSVYMDSTSTVAGTTCVDVRLQPANEGMPVVEFGIAEGVPFPCYSRYGEGEDAVEIRLTRIE